MSDTYPDQHVGNVAVLIRNFLWCPAGELLFSHHANRVIIDFGVENSDAAVPVKDFITGR